MTDDQILVGIENRVQGDTVAQKFPSIARFENEMFARSDFFMHILIFVIHGPGLNLSKNNGRGCPKNGNIFLAEKFSTEARINGGSTSTSIARKCESPTEIHRPHNMVLLVSNNQRIYFLTFEMEY
jgi:hypothetical protein